MLRGENPTYLTRCGWSCPSSCHHTHYMIQLCLLITVQNIYRTLISCVVKRVLEGFLLVGNEQLSFSGETVTLSMCFRKYTFFLSFYSLDTNTTITTLSVYTVPSSTPRYLGQVTLHETFKLIQTFDSENSVISAYTSSLVRNFHLTVLSCNSFSVFFCIFVSIINSLDLF